MIKTVIFDIGNVLVDFCWQKMFHGFGLEGDAFEKFAQFGEKHQLRRRNLMLKKSRRLFERSIYGNIINNVGERADYLMFLCKDDPVVVKAQEILDKGLSFPAASTTEK